MKTATRPIPSTTLFYSDTLKKPWDLTWLVCGEPKDRSSNSFCVQQPRDSTWMGACMPTPWMLIRTIVWTKTKCFSSLTEAHACNPSYLWLTPQTLPSSSFHLSLHRISAACKKITKWHYFLYLFNLPFPSCNSSHNRHKHVPSTSKHSTNLNDFSLFSTHFYPLPFVNKRVCSSSPSHNTNIHKFLVSLNFSVTLDHSLDV